jgi:putative iron-dependent peroxidase
LARVTPQPGIFALGTASHAYLEFDRVRGADAAELVARVAGLREPRTTIGGVNLVSGFRPEVWVDGAGGAAPAGLRGFDDAVTGPDGFTMPGTQHDAVLWVSGSAYDVVFDTARAAIAALDGVATVVHETSSWPYRHDRDLTGFVDGTENPSLVDAPSVVAVPDGQPGAGSSVVLHQLWRHDTARWEGEPVATQERAMGRTKPDSIELDPLPVESHVARTTVEVDGEEKDIFRRNVAYGGVGDHGTVFVGFSLEQWRLAEMLRRMAGVPDGVRCALTRYLSPLTGAYYVVPSVGALGRFAPPEE